MKLERLAPRPVVGEGLNARLGYILAGDAAFARVSEG